MKPPQTPKVNLRLHGNIYGKVGRDAVHIEGNQDVSIDAKGEQFLDVGRDAFHIQQHDFDKLSNDHLKKIREILEKQPNSNWRSHLSKVLVAAGVKTADAMVNYFIEYSGEALLWIGQKLGGG